MKRPSFQFYPADWRKDVALQSCSLAARGLWIELICLANESETYGFLIINGSKMDEKAISKLVGETRSKTARLLGELESKGVFSRDTHGVIFSRRMVKDEHLRTVRADAGKQGGNPALVANKVKQTDKKKDVLLNQTSNQIPTPSSSSSSSSSTSVSPHTPPAAVVDDWDENMPSHIANRMTELSKKINGLHPAWGKRPHFSAKELHCLHDNSSAWLFVTDDDWRLLKAYMQAVIPDEWRKDPRDFLQNDNRIGLIGMGPTSVLSNADKWASECRKRKMPTGIESAAATN